MTNFEKWKNGLTVEEVSAILLDTSDCRNCPAQKFCCLHGNKCKNSFSKWANAPAEDKNRS